MNLIMGMKGCLHWQKRGGFIFGHSLEILAQIKFCLLMSCFRDNNAKHGQLFVVSVCRSFETAFAKN
jgi:hypothetical protein